MNFLQKFLDNTTAQAIVLAFVGYLATAWSARMLARRKDKLEQVNRRLNEFYGPLYVASQAGNIAYRSLLKKQGKSQSFPILDSEMKEWMLWMTTIFMPLNDVREKIIIEKAYLIVEEQMPHCRWTLSPTWWVIRRCSPNGPRATTPSAAPPSAGPRSSTSMWSAPTPHSKPSRPACCIARCGGSGTGWFMASGANAAGHKRCGKGSEYCISLI